MIVRDPEAIFNHFMRGWPDPTYPPMLKKLCSFVQWTREGLCIIRDQNAKLIPMHLNRQQEHLTGCMMFQASLGMPIRIIGLKARKTGFTTNVQTLDGFICSHYDNQVSVLMANIADNTVEIFDIAKLVFEQYLAGSEPLTQTIRFREKRSRYSCRTAGGKGAGAGGTPTMLHLSEVALCDQKTKKDLYTSTTAVPDHPETMIVQESTARGRDEFWDTFDQARTNPKHPYVAVFIPWFMDDRLTVPVHENVEFDEYEMWMKEYAKESHNIELTAGMVLWRRNKIMLMVGGLPIFRQEYPATPEESVQGRASLILPNLRECIIDELPFKPEHVSGDCCVGGIDFGYNDPTVILKGYWVDQVLYLVDVYHATGKLARDHAPHIVNGHTYFCDPSGLSARKEIVDELSPDIYANLIPCPRMYDPTRVNKTNDPEWESLRKSIIDGRFKVLRSCAHQVVLEAENFEWDEKSGQPNQKRNPGIWWHFDTLDGLRYMHTGCVLGCTEAGEVLIYR